MKCLLPLLFLLPFAVEAETLRITNAGSTIKAHVQVEIADDYEERQRGLMFRRSVPKGTGMLFHFDPPQPAVKFWMKNTLVALDILFADVKGRVFHIEKDMVPHDLTPRGPKSTQPVSIVLELPSGSVEAWKLGEGDMLAIVPPAR